MAKKSNQERLAKLRQDYERAKEEIRALGHIVPGTIQRRHYSCGKPNCRCVTEGILHGPYYQWTRKIGGKTVNINVERETAGTLKSWIQNNRKLRKLCVRLEKTSLAALRIMTDLEKI
jgi:hypothetical protein